ncbi:hypothetical protein ACFL2Q_05850, partial [Thermodesulfobacteriota bacterium]
RRPVQGKPPKPSRLDSHKAEEDLVRSMLLVGGYIDWVLECALVKDLENPVLRDLAEMMVSHKDRFGDMDPSAFHRALDDEELSSIVDDHFSPEYEGEQVAHQAGDFLLWRRLKKRREEIRERMKKCVPCDEEWNELAREYTSLARHER